MELEGKDLGFRVSQRRVFTTQSARTRTDFRQLCEFGLRIDLIVGVFCVVAMFGALPVFETCFNIPKDLWQPYGLTVCCISDDGQKDLRHSGLKALRCQ